MTTVRRRPASKRKPPLDLQQVVKTFTEQREAKRLEAANKAKAEKLRDELMPLVEQYGKAHGEKGQHLAIELPEPVDGMKFLVRRRNASPFIDVDKAEALAQERGFLNEIQDGVVSFNISADPATAKKIADALRKALPVEAALLVQHENRFSQERLMAYHQKHREGEKGITEEELDGLFDEDVKYSFNPEKP